MTRDQVFRHHKECHRGHDFDDCRKCGRDQAICHSKRIYAAYADADEVAQAINEKERYAAPVVRYRCRWCDNWHLTSKLNTYRRGRVKRAYRKWRIRQELELRAISVEENQP
jgi:hypothetical protein